MIHATLGGPVDDARSGTLNRETAPGSEGGAMPEGYACRGGVMVAEIH